MGKSSIRFILPVLLILGASFAPASAGITISNYQVAAGTNAFAPLFQDQYSAQQILENISPAHSQVSGDWTGPNAGGASNTWHWVGAAEALGTTTFDSNRLV